MDRTQVVAFCDYMIGDRAVGGADPGDIIGTPHSPELLAFIVARLGDNTPAAGYGIVPQPGRPPEARRIEQGKALAALLREVADAIDAPVAVTQ